MPKFYSLLLSIAGRAPVTLADRVTDAAESVLQAVALPRRRLKSQAPPIFRGDNRLRRDIGLPPVDDRGLPL